MAGITRSEEHLRGNSRSDTIRVTSKDLKKREKEKKKLYGGKKVKIEFAEKYQYIEDIDEQDATNFRVDFNEETHAVTLNSWSNEGQCTKCQLSWFYVDKNGFLHAGNKSHHWRLGERKRYFNPNYDDQTMEQIMLYCRTLKDALQPQV